MVVQLLYASVLCSLPLFLTQVYAQKNPDSADSDQFYFPSSNPEHVYYNEDTLLVKYSLGYSGSTASSLTLSLRCVARTDSSVPSWNMDLSKATTVGEVKRDIPLHVGTVPFVLPALQDYQTVYGPAACFFLLTGRTRSSQDTVSVPSSIIQIGYDAGHHRKTYISDGSKGQVPNGNYEIIDGNGTYDIKKSSGLSTGAKAGIGAGVAVGAIALLALGFFLWRRRRQKAKAPPAGAASISEPGENKRDDEARVGELHGDHVNELSGKHNHPRHEMGPGVERAELGGDQVHARFELP